MWAYLPHDTSKDHDIMILMVHETSYIFLPLDSDFGSRKYFEDLRLGTCPVPFEGFVLYRKVSFTNLGPK